MAINFPPSPSNGTTYDANGITYVYDSAKRIWKVSATSNVLYTTTVAEGTNKYYTDARARDAISVTGSGSYDNATGVITVTGGVTSVNGQTGAATLNTSHISESGNLYFTEARARAAVTNTSISNITVSGVATFGSNVNIAGNLNVTGNVTTFSSNTVTIKDPMIYIGDDNAGDVLDLGFVSSFTNPSYQHTGLVRDATDGKWKLFANVVSEPSATIDFTNATYSTLKVGALEATANVNAAYFIGDGSSLSNISAAITFSSTAPASPRHGDQWLDSNDGTCYTYLNDGTSSQWAELGSINIPTLTTANVTETTNLYFTNARSRAAITAGTSMTYDSANGIISFAGSSDDAIIFSMLLSGL